MDIMRIREIRRKNQQDKMNVEETKSDVQII